MVLAVTFRLTRGPRSAPVRYPDLAAELGVAPGDQVPLQEARSAVLKVRARKGMVWTRATRTPAARARSSPTRS